MDQGCVIEVINHSANRVVVLFCQTNSKTQKKQLKNQREKRIYLEKKNLKIIPGKRLCNIFTCCKPSKDKFRSSKLNTLKEEKK